MKPELIPIIAASYFDPIVTGRPVRDWKHDPERARKAEEKRLRRNEKRKQNMGVKK